MNPSKSEGLKIGLAGMIGCLLALMFAWRWSESVLARALAIPVGFICGWIAYAPISFFAAFPRAWCRVVNYRPPEGSWATMSCLLGVAFAATNWGTLIFLGLILLASIGTPTPNVNDWWLLTVSPSLSLLIVLIGGVIVLTSGPMTKNNVGEERAAEKKNLERGYSFQLPEYPVLLVAVVFVSSYPSIFDSGKKD